MKKAKKQFNIKALALSSVVSVGLLSYISFNNYTHKPVSFKETGNYAYPKQYSDEHITSNAVVTDPKFKKLSEVRSDRMLASLASTFKKSTGSIADNTPENGTWLWTPVLDQTDTYQKRIISEAKKRGVTNIYLSIDSYLDIYIMADGPEKTSKRAQFDKKVESFLSLAGENGISVDAEAGWRNWSEPGNSYKAFAIVDYAVKFNKNHSSKFRGIQYDVEPYLLPAYQENKSKVLFNFVNLIDETVVRLDKSDLTLSVVIPEFYDGENNMTPKFVYNGEKNYAIYHLLKVLDKREGSKILVMSYRNFSQGKNGAIEISRGEVTAGDNHKTKIVIAQETGNVEPSYITFYNTSQTYYKKQLALIENAFSKNKSYNGVAVHYINSFLDLK